MGRGGRVPVIGPFILEAVCARARKPLMMIRWRLVAAPTPLNPPLPPNAPAWEINGPAVAVMVVTVSGKSYKSG